MDDILRFILSLSIGFAVIIGIVRLRKMDKSYYPFFYNVVVALIVEILNRILTVTGHPVAFLVVLNVFAYIDFFLFLWLFQNWGLFDRKRSVFIAIAGAFLLMWIITSLMQGFTTHNYYFFVLYAFALIFFSVNTFNKAVVNERISIFRNPKFWICLGIIIFYSFFIVHVSTGISYFRHKIASVEFRQKLQSISVYSNLLVNLLYAVAMIWVPRKKNFTSLF